MAMYSLKQQPEDFEVSEISMLGRGIEIKEKGDFLYCTLKKKDFTTLKAIEIIAMHFGLHLKHIGYAGNKDRKAVTAQSISIYDPGNRIKSQNFNEKNISLEEVGRGDCPISLGELHGNEFKIVVRKLEDEKITKKERIINFYGEQRFSKDNKEIGKLLAKKDFKKAAELILETEGEFERAVKKHLIEFPTDYVNAIKKLPRKLVSMYVHSYQSFLWNIAAEKMKGSNEDIELPIIGFATEMDEYDEKVADIFRQIMKEENIDYRDFIIKQLGSVSAAGDRRKLFAEIKGLEIGDYETDDLNLGRKKVTVKFSLPKGSYATEAIKQMIDND